MFNMKSLISALTLVILLSSCALNSQTTFNPNDSFILGNNEPDAFKVKLKNISNYALEIYHASIEGGRHSSKNIKPNESVT